MTHLPNIISVLRIAGSIGLLYCDVIGWSFWALYALCGISDMVTAYGVSTSKHTKARPSRAGLNRVRATGQISNQF